MPTQNIPSTNGYPDQTQPLPPFNSNSPYNPPNLPPGSPQIFQPPASTGFGFNQPPQPLTHGTFNQNAINSNFQQQPTPPVQATQEQPQIIQKPPIPDEHKSMQTVFEDLRSRCSCTASNPVGFY